MTAELRSTSSPRDQSVARGAWPGRTSSSKYSRSHRSRLLCTQVSELKHQLEVCVRVSAGRSCGNCPRFPHLHLQRASMRTSMSDPLICLILMFDLFIWDLIVSPCCHPQFHQFHQFHQRLHQSLRSHLKREYRQRPGCSCGFVLD